MQQLEPVSLAPGSLASEQVFSTFQCPEHRNFSQWHRSGTFAELSVQSPCCPFSRLLFCGSMLAECGQSEDCSSPFTHCLFSLVPRRTLVRLFCSVRRTKLRGKQQGGPGVLAIQGEPLESSPWLGIQKSLCRPDVFWPPKQTPARKLLEDINSVVTELGPAWWFGTAL